MALQEPSGWTGYPGPGKQVFRRRLGPKAFDETQAAVNRLGACALTPGVQMILLLSFFACTDAESITTTPAGVLGPKPAGAASQS